MPRATVVGVSDYRRREDGVVLSCDVEFDQEGEDERYTLSPSAGSATLEFYAPSIFRFEFATAAGPDAGAAERAGDPPAIDPAAVSRPVSLSCVEREGVLEVSSGELTVRIGLEEWSFRVEDADGDRLLEEQRDDVNAKGERRTDPLGFDIELVNEWPYRTAATGAAYVLGADEHLFGFGESFTEFDKRGQRVESWVTQPHGAATGASYKNVPFYLSTRGYGLLVDTCQRTTFDVGATSTVSTEITVDDDAFSFVLFGGPSFERIIPAYTALTGRPGSVPKWSLGVWMSRMSYESREELESTAGELRDRGFPCDVLNLDPGWLREGHLCDLVWDREAFPDPEGIVESLRDDGFRLCLWEYPYLLSGTDAFAEAAENGYLVGDPRGGPYLLYRLSWATDRGGIVDFTNPEAREWWAGKHAELVDMGVAAFKTDFGEYLPEDAVLHDGRDGAAARNEYPLLYTRTVHRAMAEAGAEPLLWARPGWTGGQRYPVHWGGDPKATFESMAASLRGGLSLSMSGYGFWSVDIGGFHGDPTPELYVRWAQFGLLGTSHARFHGTTPREPWAFGEEAFRIVKRYAEERYRLLPYLHALAETASREGLPVMRPVVLEFQSDRATYDLQTQYMLGDALLVAPVFEPDGSRSVYLPAGEWVDYCTGERLDGSRTIDVEPPLDRLPLYRRAGEIVPTRPPTRHVEEPYDGRVTLEVPPRTDGPTAATRTVYETDEAGIEVGVEADAPVAGGDGHGRDAGGRTVRFDVPADRDEFAAELVAVGQEPAGVLVNGDRLERVEGEPAPGEWTVADGDAFAVF